MQNFQTTPLVNGGIFSSDIEFLRKKMISLLTWTFLCIFIY